MLSAPRLALNTRYVHLGDWVLDAIAASVDPRFQAAQRIIIKNQVTGRLLLFADDDYLEETFGVSSGLEREKILAKITALADTADEKPRVTGGPSAEEGGAGHSLEFWE